MITAAAVKDFLKRRLAPEMQENGVAELTDSTSLTDTGMLDSIGLLQLVIAVGEEFHVEIELGDVDPDVFTTVGGFADTVVSRVA